MRTRIRHFSAPILTMVFAALVVASAPAFAQQDSRPGIAVLPFDVTQLPPTDLGGSGLNFGLQHILLSELGGNPALRIIERRVLNEVMDEFGLHGSANIDQSTQAELGRIVFARYMVGTSYFDDRGNVRLDARVIDVETTEIILTARVNGRDELFDLLGELAAAVTDGVDLPPLPTAVREARTEVAMPMEAIRLLSLAVREHEAGETDQAIQYLTAGIDRYPNVSDFEDLRAEILGA
jgi:TolB-like protein